jgi:4-coumarate--CoA ligase
MFEISGGSVDCSIPDDLTIPQFFLDSHHPLRPARQAGVPWLIEDATGRPIDFEEVRVSSPRRRSILTESQLRTRTFGLANALQARYGLSE